MIFYPELAVGMPLPSRALSLDHISMDISKPPASWQPERWALMQVVSCHIIKHRDTQKPRGCFVEFETVEDLEKALKKDGTVSLAPSCCVAMHERPVPYPECPCRHALHVILMTVSMCMVQAALSVLHLWKVTEQSCLADGHGKAN